MISKKISLTVNGEDMSFDVKCADEQAEHIIKALKNAADDEYAVSEVLRLLEAEKELQLIGFDDSRALKQYLRYSMGMPYLRLVKGNACMLLVLRSDAEKYIKYLKNTVPSTKSAAEVKLEKLNEQLKNKTSIKETKGNNKQTEPNKDTVAQLVEEEIHPFLENIYFDLKEIKKDVDKLKLKEEE